MADRIGQELRERIAQAWDNILDGIASGHEVCKVLEVAGFTRSNIRAYLADKDAREQWDDAREASADSFMDEAFRVARNPYTIARNPDGSNVLDKLGNPLIIPLDSGHVRALVDTAKWGARIRNPRQYSDKATLDVNVRTVDLTRIINDAQARLEASRQVGNAALLAPIMGLAQRVLESQDTQVVD